MFKVGPETVYDAGERCGVPQWAVADLWIAQPDGSYREQTSQMFSAPVPLVYNFADVRVGDFNGYGVPDMSVALTICNGLSTAAV